MNTNLTLRDQELLSAYLDGQLSDVDRNSVEQNLETRGEWRLMLDELDQTRRVLRRAPRYRAPRSFALTPEMAKQARRSFLTNLIGMRVSAAMATLALVVALVMQGSPILANQGASPLLSAAPAMQQDAAEGAVAMEAAPVEKAAAEATPMIITWGSPAYAYGTGGGGGGGMDTMTSGPQDLAAPAPKIPGADSPPAGEAPAAEERIAVESETPIQGSGPILGVPGDESAGQILTTSESAPIYTQEDFESAPKGLIALRGAQIGLIVLAVIAGVAAFLFARRRSV